MALGWLLEVLVNLFMRQRRAQVVEGPSARSQFLADYVGGSFGVLKGGLTPSHPP